MKPELTNPCPKCHALAGESCKNYKGQNCAPHSGRVPKPETRERKPRKPTPAFPLTDDQKNRLVKAVTAWRRMKCDPIAAGLVAVIAKPTGADVIAGKIDFLIEIPALAGGFRTGQYFTKTEAEDAAMAVNDFIRKT